MIGQNLKDVFKRKAGVGLDVFKRKAEVGLEEQNSCRHKFRHY